MGRAKSLEVEKKEGRDGRREESGDDRKSESSKGEVNIKEKDTLYKRGK